MELKHIDEKKRNSGLKILAGCAVTAVITAAGLLGLTKIMEEKTAATKYQEFFAHAKDVDVLFMGTSHVIYGVFPMELWDDYGIASYNFGGHANAMATNYWVMENALDYADPELMVIDCVGIGDANFGINPDAKTDEESFSFVHQSFDAFPLSKHKVEAVLDLLNDEVAAGFEDDPERSEKRTRLGLLWDYSVYHSRWEELKKEDFAPEIPYQRGAEPGIGIAAPMSAEKIDRSDRYEGDSVSVQYLRKMIEDCQERAIPVLLTTLPFPASEDAQRDANRVYEIAEEYGVDYLNFLDMNDVVNLDIDCLDSTSHLNVSGGKKVSDYLGKYITEHYNVPDRRAEAAYAAWNEDFRCYENNKTEEIQRQENLDLYLMLLADSDYTVYMEFEDPELLSSEYYGTLFANMGVDAEMVNEGKDVVILSKAKGNEYYSGFAKDGDEISTSLGTLLLSTAEDAADGENGLNQAHTVYRDDEVFYDVERYERADVRILVLDRDGQETYDISNWRYTGKKDMKDGDVAGSYVIRRP